MNTQPAAAAPKIEAPNTAKVTNVKPTFKKYAEQEINTNSATYMTINEGAITPENLNDIITIMKHQAEAATKQADTANLQARIIAQLLKIDVS